MTMKTASHEEIPREKPSDTKFLTAIETTQLIIMMIGLLIVGNAIVQDNDNL